MAKEKNNKNGSSNNIAQFQMERKRKFGPIQNRSCTDILCLLLFIIFIGVWGYMLTYFYRYVDVERTLNPSDIYGNVCGKGNFKDRKYLAFFNILTCGIKFESSIIDGCQTPQVCVKECPNITFSINDVTSTSRKIRALQAENAICLYGEKPTEKNILQLVKDGKCAELYFNSDPIGGRCLPSIIKIVQGFEIFDEIAHTNLNGTNGAITPDEMIKNNQIMATLIKAMAFGTQIASDIAKTWQLILIGLCVSMIIAFFWIFLMQFIARYMVWLSILAIFVVTIFGLYYCSKEYLRLRNGGNENESLDLNKLNETVRDNIISAISRSSGPSESLMPKSLKYIRAGTSIDNRNKLTFDLDLNGKLQDQLNQYRNNSTTWLVLSIILAVILLIITSMLLCLCSRIDLAIRVIEEASKAVNCMKSTLFFPIVPYVLKMIAFTGWLFAVIIIASGSHPQYRDPDGKLCIPEHLSPDHVKHIGGKSHQVEPLQGNCTFTRPFTRNLVYGAHAFNIFGIIWLIFFLMGCCYITLSGAFASYYWTFHKDEVPFFALLGSGYRCIRYHLGSVAFGSLLISIVRFIRIILEFIDAKCKKYSNNVVARAIMCCMKCCFWCLENFIRYINKNAYIMIAIYGKNFCASAKDAFLMLATNGIRSLVLSWLSTFLLFLSKLAVTALVGVAGFYVMSNQATFLIEINGLNFFWAPLVLFIILSYIVTSSFFNVYDVAIETIFLCYLEDCSKNDGSKEKPYYMSKNLRKVLNE